MTRQDTVIKIAKITKIIGEWKFRYDLDGEVEMELCLQSCWILLLGLEIYSNILKVIPHLFLSV